MKSTEQEELPLCERLRLAPEGSIERRAIIASIPCPHGFGKPHRIDRLWFYDSERDKDDVIWLHEGGFPNSCKPSWMQMGGLGSAYRRGTFRFRVGSTIARLNGIEESGKIDGIVFAVSNDGGKTGVCWRDSVFEAFDYLRLQNADGPTDYTVVAVPTTKPKPETP